MRLNQIHEVLQHVYWTLLQELDQFLNLRFEPRVALEMHHNFVFPAFNAHGSIHYRGYVVGLDEQSLVQLWVVANF